MPKGSIRGQQTHGWADGRTGAGNQLWAQNETGNGKGGKSLDAGLLGGKLGLGTRAGSNSRGGVDWGLGNGGVWVSFRITNYERCPCDLMIGAFYCWRVYVFSITILWFREGSRFLGCD